MRWLILWAVGTVSLPAAPAAAETPPDFGEPEVRAEFMRMRLGEGYWKDVAKRLGARSFVEREKAESKLEGVYWLGRDWLREQVIEGGAEMGYRLERIAKKAEGNGVQFVRAVGAIGAGKFAGELFDLGGRIGGEGALAESVRDVLRRCEPGAVDAEVVAKNLEHRWPGYRVIALKMLHGVDGEMGLEAALRLIEDEDAEVKFSAATLLLEKGEKRAVRAMVGLLGSETGQFGSLAHRYLVDVAGKEVAEFGEEGSEKAWRVWLAGLPDPVPIPEGGFGKMPLMARMDGVGTLKMFYTPGEPIRVEVTKFSGAMRDWVTLVEASTPDTGYGQYFYGEGKNGGTFDFKGVQAGEYEVRVYHDWPDGGFEVKSRWRFEVK